MKQRLEVTFAFEVQVELPNDLDATKSVAELRAGLGTKPLALTLGAVEIPTQILFQRVVITPPYAPRPDEFRCDNCRRECSNDEKSITDEGDELCENCVKSAEEIKDPS